MTLEGFLLPSGVASRRFGVEIHSTVTLTIVVQAHDTHYSRTYTLTVQRGDPVATSFGNVGVASAVPGTDITAPNPNVIGYLGSAPVRDTIREFNTIAPNELTLTPPEPMN